MSKPLAVAAPSPLIRPASPRRTLIAVALGNWLELYDFTVFSFFAMLIGKLYFPSDSEYGSLLMALATFGIGFVVRPLGGLAIGRIADRSGRKPALTLTIWLMAAGTALIGLAPTHADIGVAAPLLIVAGRLLQGFAAGGEIGASTSYLMEFAPKSRRGFMVSWQTATQGAAVLVGAASGALLTALLTVDALESWGWRLPFLFGLLIGPLGLYIRGQLDETHRPEASRQPGLLRLASEHRRTLLLGSMLVMGMSANTYVIANYMPSYLSKVLHMPPSSALLSGCAAGLMMLLASPPAGWLADRLRRRKPLLLAVNTLLLLLTLPCFALLLGEPTLRNALLLATLLTTILALGCPAGFLLVMEALPRHGRATGLAVVYACGVTVFGGFAQFIVTWLISVSGDPLAPAWYAMACTGLSLLALILFHERPAAEAD
ncbi:MFS transporter [Chromobacterium vaccinii]|uniref:MFS transporter n=1 Tax=Chromobacterium vaccinii TaxID=1108595 RepID=UPI003C71483F